MLDDNVELKHILTLKGDSTLIMLIEEEMINEEVSFKDAFLSINRELFVDLMNIIRSDEYDRNR